MLKVIRGTVDSNNFILKSLVGLRWCRPAGKNPFKTIKPDQLTTLCWFKQGYVNPLINYIRLFAELIKISFVSYKENICGCEMMFRSYFTPKSKRLSFYLRKIKVFFCIMTFSWQFITFSTKNLIVMVKK